MITNIKEKQLISEESFNKALRIVMAEFNISGRVLSEATGLSTNSISAARNGSRMHSDTIIKIANALRKLDEEAYVKFWVLVSGCDSYKIS